MKAKPQLVKNNQLGTQPQAENKTLWKTHSTGQAVIYIHHVSGTTA